MQLGQRSLAGAIGPVAGGGGSASATSVVARADIRWRRETGVAAEHRRKDRQSVGFVQKKNSTGGGSRAQPRFLAASYYAALIRGLGFIDSCCKLRHSTRRTAVYCFWIGAPVSVGDRLVMNDNNRRSSSYIVSDLLQGGDDGRYLKTFKSTDPAWFYLHISCQMLGYVIGVVGWATGLVLGNKSKGIVHTNHRNIGITLFTFCTLQHCQRELTFDRSPSLRFPSHGKKANSLLKFELEIVVPNRSGPASLPTRQLEDKQKLWFHYGLTKRQLLKYVRIAGKTKGSTGQVLLQLLEMHLDNILFRLGIASTIPGARYSFDNSWSQAWSDQAAEYWKQDIAFTPGHMYRTNWGIGHGLKDILEAHKGPFIGQGHKGLYEILTTSWHAQLSLNLAMLGSLTIVVAHHMYSMPPYPYLAIDYGTQLSLFTHHM
ncbi:hypothetical protein ZIOFF_043241 [Zingiber officinale]|uniref:Small ribosomal subunit protein uS4 N-terminal domain-containing protein n=1 Tax=Zingiber officinale TaxID=94328 RepID=A0A8J5FUW9_ZINOF|nr:hypothetical protein ZIOFF_043241 [Zingiber officinale]